MQNMKIWLNHKPEISEEITTETHLLNFNAIFFCNYNPCATTQDEKIHINFVHCRLQAYKSHYVGFPLIYLRDLSKWQAILWE